MQRFGMDELVSISRFEVGFSFDSTTVSIAMFKKGNVEKIDGSISKVIRILGMIELIKLSNSLNCSSVPGQRKNMSSRKSDYKIG